MQLEVNETVLMSASWELDTKPLNTVYQGLMHKPWLISLTLRCQTKRTLRPTTIIPPLPNLKTLIVYDIDPLCYPDDISLLLLSAKKLENLKLHYNPRMRDMAEESGGHELDNGNIEVMDHYISPSGANVHRHSSWRPFTQWWQRKCL